MTSNAFGEQVTRWMAPSYIEHAHRSAEAGSARFHIKPDAGANGGAFRSAAATAEQHA
jgi:hypothetical protein